TGGRHGYLLRRARGCRAGERTAHRSSVLTPPLPHPIPVTYPNPRVHGRCRLYDHEFHPLDRSASSATAGGSRTGRAAAAGAERRPRHAPAETVRRNRGEIIAERAGGCHATAVP